MPAPSVDEILSVVRDHGGRATPARRAILQVLIDSAHGHPTAERITTTVRASQPDVAESTVYRFLDELVRLGVVQQVRLGPSPAVYHFAAESHHHHLLCATCGRQVEVPDDVLDPLRRRLRDEFAFEIEPVHFTLSGHCADCAPAAAPGHASG